MYGASLSPDPRDSTSFFRASGQKSLGPDLALRETHDRDGGQKYTAVANMPRRNPRVLSATMCPTEFPEHARRLSSALFETAHLPPAMFPVSISYRVAYYHRSNMSRAKSSVAEGRHLKRFWIFLLPALFCCQACRASFSFRESERVFQ